MMTSLAELGVVPGLRHDRLLADRVQQVVKKIKVLSWRTGSCKALSVYVRLLKVVELHGTRESAGLYDYGRVAGSRGPCLHEGITIITKNK